PIIRPLKTYTFIQQLFHTFQVLLNFGQLCKFSIQLHKMVLLVIIEDSVDDGSLATSSFTIQCKQDAFVAAENFVQTLVQNPKTLFKLHINIFDNHYGGFKLDSSLLFNVIHVE